MSAVCIDKQHCLHNRSLNPAFVAIIKSIVNIASWDSRTFSDMLEFKSDLSDNVHVEKDSNFLRIFGISTQRMVNVTTTFTDV
jgi:hypothetical protein